MLSLHQQLVWQPAVMKNKGTNCLVHITIYLLSEFMTADKWYYFGTLCFCKNCFPHVLLYVMSLSEMAGMGWFEEEMPRVSEIDPSYTIVLIDSRWSRWRILQSKIQLVISSSRSTMKSYYFSVETIILSLSKYCHPGHQTLSYRLRPHPYNLLPFVLVKAAVFAVANAPCVFLHLWECSCKKRLLVSFDPFSTLLIDHPQYEPHTNPLSN